MISKEEHERHLPELFTRLQQYGVFVNPAKCVFGAANVRFLGYQVSGEGTGTPSDQIKAIKEFPQPSTIKQLRQFLGTLNFYKRFIDSANDQTRLNGIIGGPKTKRKATIQWTTELSDAFKKCKESLARATLLSYPDPETKLVLVTDASGTALGAVIQL